MPFFNLCPDDPLVKTLQSVFNANIVRIPEARIQPFTAIALTKGKPRFWGALGALLEGPVATDSLTILESRMADVSGKRSKSVDINVGLKILDGFLSGFGVPAAGVAANFKGAEKVSFSFQQVMRYYVAPAEAGAWISGRALNKQNAATGIFFDDEAGLMLIDSVITSKDFSISVDKSDSLDFALNIPAIEQIIGNAKTSVKVASGSKLAISFEGDAPLTFAFTCLNCQIDAAGRISLKPSAGNVHFFAPSAFEHQMIYRQPGMLEWEE